MNMNNFGRGGTACMSKASLAVGGTATGVAIASLSGAGIYYSIDGLMYYAADAATTAITAAAVQAISTSCIYLVCMNAAGTLSTVKGTAVSTASLTAGDVVLEWPVPLASTCPIGAFRIDTGDTNAFTAGTTDLDNTGNTDTYYDFFLIPGAPLTA